MLTVVVLVLVAVVAAVWLLDIGAPRVTVDAVVASVAWVPERGADGRTRITVRTGDGQVRTLTRPGRQSLKSGDAVRAVLVRGRVVSLSAADPASGPR